MPRFSANLSMLFTEHAFLDRFEPAAKAGFKAVEFLFPYASVVQAPQRRMLLRSGYCFAMKCQSNESPTFT